VRVFDIDPTPFGSLELLQVVSGTRSTWVSEAAIPSLLLHS